MSNYRRYYNFGKTVFITIVTSNRNPILIDNIELVKESLKSVKYNFKIIACVVLKDHIHIIIEPDNMKNIPYIVSFFKQNFSKNLKNKPERTDIQKQRQENNVWQRRYYDHIIRDENDFNRHLDYIHFNPMKHYGIAPKDWNYSSFKRFVNLNLYDENWCNYDNRNSINDLDLE